MKEQGLRSTWPREGRVSLKTGDSLRNMQGGRTAEIAGLRLTPLAQLFLNSPCPVKQDDRREEKKGCTRVNRKLSHHCQGGSDTLKVST